MLALQDLALFSRNFLQVARWSHGSLSNMNGITFGGLSENACDCPLCASGKYRNKRPTGRVGTLLGTHSGLDPIKIYKRSHQDKIR